MNARIKQPRFTIYPTCVRTAGTIVQGPSCYYERAIGIPIQTSLNDFQLLYCQK